MSDYATLEAYIGKKRKEKEKILIPCNADMKDFNISLQYLTYRHLAVPRPLTVLIRHLDSVKWVLGSLQSAVCGIKQILDSDSVTEEEEEEFKCSRIQHIMRIFLGQYPSANICLNIYLNCLNTYAAPSSAEF